ncbi:DNA helicase [Streptomyces capoamus]|uniref:DNA 3'-5' helicase n=1 Tax=Streptomyces capoamus TaxID=68183 RepID=A0A919F2V7_9ACTN|nr:UvrD-helicase domain-containing protein [Streptomyces capoamus]GGP32407.1 DNA helicase [Streptomyces libani subsp. rufus]GHG72584.1 DNA helicase [Streptomyces capoamus]
MIEAKRSGAHLALQAGAGTGKTTVLVMAARSDRRRGMYLAYNRPVVDDAARKFPSNVPCLTGHGLAMRTTGRQYSARLNTPREPSWKIGERLGIPPTMQVRLGPRLLTHKTISYSVLQTVKRFCHSADDEIHYRHVPTLKGLPDDYRPDLARIVLPYARRAWKDLQNPERGAVRFEPDHYLKIWALTTPTIPADFLLLDEAQDTNPVLEQVFLAQRSHAQLIMVGDSAQAIYGWRGARDVMTGFDGTQLHLTQSFRFGPALATEANRWLAIVESPLRLKGSPAIDTSVGPVDNPDAVLCRSNAGAIREVLALLADGRRVAMVGGGEALEKLARAAGELKAGHRTGHPELVLFTTWDELYEYATTDPSGTDLLPLVEIIEDHGVDVVLQAVRSLYPEHDAQVVISTAHKSKGREWPTVRIAADFELRPGNKASETETDEGGNPLPDIDLGEARLAYVAVTRARQRLDLGGLSWINNFPQFAVQAGDHPGPAPVHSSPWDRLGPPTDRRLPADSA